MKGDTALHVASRAGDEGAVRVLVRLAKNSPRRTETDDVSQRPDILLLRSTNNEGNTALHEAIITNGHERVVECLMEMDQQVVYYVNNQGKSPFYIAVESGKVATTASMWEVMIRQQGYSSEIFRGKSLVHAAIRGRNKGLLETLLNKMPTLIQLRDEGGETPLHCAASIAYLEGVQYLLGKSSDLIFERDDNGFFPVHIASEKGHMDIVRKLLQHCPYSRELLTKHGDNILHVAAKSGKINVVDHILKSDLEHDQNSPLVNEKDGNGNTPLHLATLYWHPKVVSSLTWDKRVYLDIANGDGMTALDVAEERMEIMASFRKRLTWMALKSAGAPRNKRSEVPKLNAQSSLEQQQHPQINMDYNYKDMINTLMLVSTLVATVTYAAGFTMPGGYFNSDPNQGIATMLNQSKFQIFVICDTIAMYSAMVDTVSLILAQLGDLNLVLNSLRLALPLLGVALFMMSLAFMAGVSLVVSKLNWLSNVVLIMGFVFLFILLMLFIPLSFPNTSNHRVLRLISYHYFCLMMLASGSYRDEEEE